jgi:hypothetical protein
MMPGTLSRDAFFRRWAGNIEIAEWITLYTAVSRRLQVTTSRIVSVGNPMDVRMGAMKST